MLIFFVAPHLDFYLDLNSQNLFIIYLFIKIYFSPKTIRLEKGKLKKHSGTRKS